jgi:branched-chain amino acid transport system substrate-binding protein
MKYAPIFLLLILLSACTAEKTSTLRVGAVLSLTNNDYANVEQEFKRGIELGVEESPVPIELYIEDDNLNYKNSVTATQKLVNIDRVDAIIFAETAQVHTAGPVAKEANIPSVIIWESSPVIEEMGTGFFGVGMWQPNAGEVPADFAYNKLQAKTASVVHDQNIWAENVAKWFIAEFERKGGKVTIVEAVPDDMTDFRGTIAKVKATKADVLFVPLGFNPDVFFKQLKESGGFKGEIMSSDGIGQEFIDAASGGMEGMYFSNADDSLSPSLMVLQEKYKKKYGEEPNNIQWVALGYDGILLIAHADQVKGDSSLSDAIAQTKEFPGAMGNITINEQGSFRRPEIMYMVKDNTAVHVSE